MRRARLFDKATVGGLEAETECRAIGAGFDVRSVEGEDQGFVTKLRERTYQCVAEADFQRLEWAARAGRRRGHCCRALRGRGTWSLGPVGLRLSPTSGWGGSSGSASAS